MSAESNESIVLHMLQAIQNGASGDVEKFFAPNWVNHDPSLPPLKGLEGARQLIALWGGFSNLNLEIEAIFSQGDSVAVRFRMSGTHSGMALGVPPTGRAVNVTATGIFRVVEEKVSDNWVNFDALGLLQQMGAIPLPVI